MEPLAIFLFMWLCTFNIFNGIHGQQVTLRLKNECPFTVWPAWLGSPQVGQGGTSLEPYESFDIVVPSSWTAGRIWGRTGCSFNNGTTGTPSTTNFACETGDCNSQLECRGIGGQPPFTIAELTLSGYSNRDFYDVSLVDGYNLPMRIVPADVNCTIAGCHSDVNSNCPSVLQVLGRTSQVVACKSACSVFQTDRFCCRGVNGGPSTCAPTVYSRLFKHHCPQAYSYAYDDLSSTFTCFSGSDYLVEFCPGGSSS